MIGCIIDRLGIHFSRQKPFLKVFSGRLFKICRCQQSNSAFGQRFLKFAEGYIFIISPPVGFSIPMCCIVLPGEINIA